MRKLLKDILQTPDAENPHIIFDLDKGNVSDNDAIIQNGFFIDKITRMAWPIINGIPSFVNNKLPNDFLNKYASLLNDHDELVGLVFNAKGSKLSSFSAEWEEYFKNENTRTWGYTAEERLEQFYMETETDVNWIKDKLILDAGCGNGVLSEELANNGAKVVGIDSSTSVFYSEYKRCNDNVHFIHGDLQHSPIKENSFDLAISIGVLHHTENTERSFRNLARLVKPGGRLYIWLYRIPEKAIRRYLRVPVYDAARLITSRLPNKIQRPVIYFWAHVIQLLHKHIKKVDNIPFSEYLISAYDDLACRWRHYHTPQEVSRWYFECGYGPVTLTHWDNPYGFGVVATRKKMESTPGIHYGSEPKLWDENNTIIG